MTTLRELTDDQLRSLAGLLATCRPHGARHWDRSETMAALRKVSQLGIADAVLAFTRAADDRHCQSPFAVTNLNSPHWRERQGTPHDAPQRPDNTPAANRCSVCMKPERDCRRDDHDYTPNVRPQLTDTERAQAAHQARARLTTTETE